MDWWQTIKEFLTDLAQKGRSPNTKEAYRLDLGSFATWYRETCGQEPTPEGVGPLDVADYRHHLNQGKKPTMVNRTLIALNNFFAWAVEKGVAPQNPEPMSGE
jgi:site-specific recombinase XerD